MPNSNSSPQSRPEVGQCAVQPPIRAVAMGLFPTLGSLQDVVNLAESRLPITNKNDLLTLLFTYHNTLLKKIQERRTRD